jgi:hypothetical protein
MKIKTPKTSNDPRVAFNLDLPLALFKKLAAHCKETGITKRKIVIDALTAFFKQEK